MLRELRIGPKIKIRLHKGSKKRVFVEDKESRCSYREVKISMIGALGLDHEIKS